MLPRPAPLPQGQVTFDCGPEAVAAILAFYGKPADVNEITRLIYHPDRNGTYAPAIPDVARQKGLANETINGSVGRLKSAVGRGRPCLIMTAVGSQLYHFFVVVGYSDVRRAVVCEDYKGAKRLISYEQLHEIWRPTAFWCLEFYPAETADDLEAAQELEANGEVDRAAAIYRRILDREPGHADAMTGLAGCAWGKGDLDAAEKWLERALEAAADHALAQANLADLLVVRGKDAVRAVGLAHAAVSAFRTQREDFLAELAKAQGARRTAVREDVEFATLQLAGATGTLGQAFAAAGRHEDAVGALRESLSLLPPDDPDRRARRHIEIGDSLRALAREEDAREEFRRALATARDRDVRATAEDRLR